MGYDDVHFQSEKDAVEEKDRMENEGGGVVMQNIPHAAPVLRGELVEVEEKNGKERLIQNGRRGTMGREATGES